MPNTFRAMHLGEEHVGQHVRFRRSGEGVLLALSPVRTREVVQLLLQTRDGADLLSVPIGEPVDTVRPLHLPPV